MKIPILPKTCIQIIHFLFSQWIRKNRNGMHGRRLHYLYQGNSKNVVKVANNKEAIYFHCDIATNNKADYFISIHVDGLTNFTSGAHVICNEGDKKGLELANDIFNCYTVVNIGKKHPDARNNVGVLWGKNQTKDKVLIELGYITPPKDAKSIYDNMDLIAEQLAQGLVININKHF
ncbi:N-acetylmuramoyl-L-alanine amidase [Gilliamella sp. B3482]|uniref:N-acetylmuramoyl-L-alanine amidase n=1 Tax=unclassified Gilliamella TaxID=2685620 RepID=UPI0011475B55|nr:MULTISPECIES: N-acetylmuramoyl-L-alanine amidase [Gilliamella]MCX8580743.1 N-acetylmuramoyl-L-alanine amidase [Gilliamella sp. B3482]